VHGEVHGVTYRMNDHTGRVCVMASEEHDDLLPIPAHHPGGGRRVRRRHFTGKGWNHDGGT